MAAPVVRREGLAIAMKNQRDFAIKVRAKHRSAMQLIQRFYPHQWDDVKWCRYHVQAQRDKGNLDRFRAQPKGCNKVPYCIVCTQEHDKWRALEKRDLLYECTPKGKPIGLYHVVITAPAVEGEGRVGWGWKARDDLAKFRGYGERLLRFMFGDGIGGVMAYQDFGEEKIFQKPAPHLDIIVFGYALKDDECTRLVKAPRLDSGGKRTLYLKSADLTRGFGLGEGEYGSNIHVSHRVEGAGLAFKVMRYAMREMVDMRDFEYDAVGGTVDHINYRRQTRSRTSAPAWYAWLEHYQRKFRPQRYNEDAKRVQLVSNFGFLGPRAVKTAKIRFGGSTPEHVRYCTCSECVDWERVVTDREGNLLDEVQYEGAGPSE